MIGRNDGTQFAFFDELRFQSGDGIGIHEPEVHFPGPHPFRDAGVVALMQDEADLRIEFLEMFDQPR
ncbi:hypothetical protein D3C74_498700 [compost metagenome]